MSDYLAPQEVQFKKVMGILGIIFLIAGALFAVIPEHFQVLFNYAGELLKMPKAPVAMEITSNIAEEKGADRLYVGMACAMMMMLVVICFANYFNPRKYMGWIPLLLVAKLTTTLLSVAFYLWAESYLSNLIAAFTDFPIFLVVLVFWLRARSAADAPYEQPPDEDEEEE